MFVRTCTLTAISHVLTTLGIHVNPRMWSCSERVDVRVFISPPSPFSHRSQSPKGKRRGEETPVNRWDWQNFWST